jgi:hypothetical protein
MPNARIGFWFTGESGIYDPENDYGAPRKSQGAP